MTVEDFEKYKPKKNFGSYIFSRAEELESTGVEKCYEFKAAVASRVLCIYEFKFPNDMRPRKAIETAAMLAKTSVEPRFMVKAFNNVKAAALEAEEYLNSTADTTKFIRNHELTPKSHAAKAIVRAALVAMYALQHGGKSIAHVSSYAIAAKDSFYDSMPFLEGKEEFIQKEMQEHEQIFKEIWSSSGGDIASIEK
jgi:hypothetical protein